MYFRFTALCLALSVVVFYSLSALKPFYSGREQKIEITENFNTGLPFIAKKTGRGNYGNFRMAYNKLYVLPSLFNGDAFKSFTCFSIHALNSNLKLNNSFPLKLRI
jgi:hypothetical protein